MSVNEHLNAKPAITIKSELGTIPRSDRLTTFKLPRDLTLGSLAVGKSTRGNIAKKVFTPNLNVARNKNTDVKTSRDTTFRGRGRGDRGAKNDRGRGRGRVGSSLIQTTGLFSEGAAGGTVAISRRSGHSSHSSGGGDTSDSAYQLRKPTINKNDYIKIDLKDEEKHMDDTISLKHFDDLDDVTQYNKTMPIMLSTSEIKKAKKIKQEHNIKVEALELKGEKIMIGDLELKQEKDDKELVKTEKIEDNIKKEYPTELITNAGYPESLDELFNKQTPQIFLLQLPDTLPGRGPDIEPAESAEFERPNTPDPTASYCTIKQLEEGNIGKIVRYKSGKTKLILGETRFDISLGMAPGFLHELVSINTNRTERSGNMINLGEIQAKLNASPDWEYILSKQVQS